MNYNFINRRLKEMHLSRRQFAIKCGIPPSTFQGWFDHKVQFIKERDAQKLADALGVDMKLLWTQEELMLLTFQSLLSEGEHTGETIGERYSEALEYLSKSRNFADNQHEGTYTQLLRYFDMLNPEGQQKAVEALRILSMVPEFTLVKIP